MTSIPILKLLSYKTNLDKFINNKQNRTKLGSSCRQQMAKMRSKTQFVQEQGNHLSINLKNIFPPVFLPKPFVKSPPSDDTELQTNFGITVCNPYSFILLHLRNKSKKNPININIPQTCIFFDRMPYDIVYSQQGYIRGLKYVQNLSTFTRVRLRQMSRTFKQVSTTKNLPKNQPSVAAFAQRQMLMLTDNDVFLVSCKTKIDSFFKKLRYIRNKIPLNNNQPIIVRYSQDQQQNQLIKLATQNLIGNRKEQQVYRLIIQQGLLQQEEHMNQEQLQQPSLLSKSSYREKLTQKQITQKKVVNQRRYLRYLNQKICLFLNYQHNIRIKSCDFVYMKTNQGQYYFVNVANLQFTNLTGAILERQKRLAQREEQRNKILILTPQKQARYRSYQSKQHTKTYQNIMDNHFDSMIDRYNLRSVPDDKRQQIRNEQAYRRLHPKSRFTYNQVLTSANFLKLKDEILQNNKRKTMTIPSKYILRHYNRIKSIRPKTQFVDVIDVMNF